MAIRAETTRDRVSIARLLEATFVDSGEASLVEKLRKQHFLTLGLVAESASKEIIGYIAYSPVNFVKSSDSKPAFKPSPSYVGLGPMAVLPAHQKQGIGSRLIRESFEHLRALQTKAIVVLGHKTYYPRFGFKPANDLNISWEGAPKSDAFMYLNLDDDALSSFSGSLVCYSPPFSEL
eukprot:m.90682 g.90682  ORF g.90682 m.90682 type:complete len:178 (+) comp21597_c1_seq4:1901-2434(+)